MAMVSYTLDTLPEISEAEWASLNVIKDEDIDFSDIPKVTDFSGFRPWRELHGKECVEAREKLIAGFQAKNKAQSKPLERPLYKPVKVAVSCKLDADILAWLKSGGKGYQTRLNDILRRAMLSAAGKERQAPPQSQ